MHEHWGKGLVPEAMHAVVDFATGELGVSELVASHAEGNPASGRVLQKLGFTESGKGTAGCSECGDDVCTVQYHFYLDEK
jgi:RimJ/RimL family protein N-acetyltransferase